MLCRHFRTCCACTCKDYVCKHSQPKWHCHFGSRAFVTQVRKFETRPPSPRMAAAPDLSQIPPSDIPDALQDGIAKLSAPLKQLLMMKSVPYLIQHRLGSENYVTVEDLADRWDSVQVARQQGPRELGFEADHNGFTAASSGFAAMKLFQVVRAAKEMIQTHPSVLATPGPGPSRPLSLTEVLCERPQLEKEFSAKWGIPKPQYRDQGSDAVLRRQYKFCSKGEIGFIHSKYIISALPEEGERPIKTRKKITVDGWEKEEEEEERAAPTTRRQLERLHLVFRNTLLMCLAAFPQFPQFNLTKEDLDSFYDWFYGPELGGRRPSPPEQTLLMAERNAWREVHESMHGGMYLKEALEKVQNNSLFWMREVYERVISERAKGKSKKGKDKKGSWGYPIRQPLWEKKGKGHGDRGGEGKGKGKSKPSDWPSNWAFKAGSAMRDPRSTSQRIALTRLEGIGRLPMALWSILETKREATSSRMTLVQQAHKHPPRFGAENHQELGVPQIAQGL